MKKAEAQKYSKKYKKVQKRLSIAVMIFIILIGLVFLTFGIIFLVSDFKTFRVVIGCIMCTAGVLNIILGIKFNTFSQKNLRRMSDQEAAERYIKIVGNTKKFEEEKKEAEKN